MRVLLSSNHRYPGSPRTGTGLQPKLWPSGSGFLIHDLVAKGLAELGHEVFYRLPEGTDEPLPGGIVLVRDNEIPKVDIVHTLTGRDREFVEFVDSRAIARVATCHLSPKSVDAIGANWIFVSRTQASLCRRRRYVLNGIDPAEHCFSESKDDYFLFAANADRAREKGLYIALRLAREIGFRLLVAGVGKTQEAVDETARQCAEARCVYVGDVRGVEKRELFAGARGLLFPTQCNEAFGLVLAEALVSGTPVICSAHGACPELITTDVGFVCNSWEDYCAAVEKIGKISPARCREKALSEYHYLRMASDYVREYQAEIDGASPAPPILS
jgi:glycosyltransferase involved in cell wall biosynthesis